MLDKKERNISECPSQKKRKRIMMKHKIIDFDPKLEPELELWEQEKIDENENIRNFQYREQKSAQEIEKIEKLIENRTTPEQDEELQKKAINIKELYAFDFWKRCFNKASYCNEIAGQALFHVCIGQALSNFRIYLEDDSAIDWRLHYLWIQDSGSGKGKAMNFVNRVFNHPKFMKIESGKRKYRTHKLGRMNAASLINTYNVDKNGLIIKDLNGLESVKLGILESNDFIFSEEGRTLLDNTKESMELQEIFMTATETIGSSNNTYTKQLTYYVQPCTTICTASFAITTRPFGKMKLMLVESGMIPRFMFFPRNLTFQDREEMNKRSSFAFKTADSRSMFQKDFNELIEQMNRTIDFAHSHTVDFDIKNIDNLQTFLYEKMMWFTQDVENNIPSDTNRYIMQGFVSRYKESMVTMAFHSAVMRFNFKVEKVDLQYAFDFFKTLYEAQKLWVSLSVEEDKDVRFENQNMIKEMTRLLKNDMNHSIELPDLVKIMAKIFNKDYGAMRYHIMKFSKGNNPVIRLDKTNLHKNPVVILC